MRNVYRQSNVAIQNDYDINIMKNAPNKEGVILQIDTPYIATVGYAAGKYTLDNLKDFMGDLVLEYK